MIAPIKKTCHSDSNAIFIAMIPAIQRNARFFFLHLKPEAREEAIEGVLAYAFVAFTRLVESGKIDLVYPSVLARFGAAQIRSGRRVGTPENKRDLLSSHAQSKNGFVVDRLDRFDNQEDEWKQIAIEDRHSGPAEVAITRIDFAAWLTTLTSHQRKIAKTLAIGESTKGAAKKFRITPGRVSQTRHELQRAWEEFVSDRSMVAA